MITPSWYVSSILEIEPDQFKEVEVYGLLLDLDNTLRNYGETAFSDASSDWLRRIKEAGIRACLFSNGSAHKVQKASQMLGIPFVAHAYKPLPIRVRTALALLGLPAEQTALVGDQLFADVLAGRLAGVRTILVEQTSRHEPWFTRLKRPLEVPFRRRLSRRKSLS